MDAQQRLHPIRCSYCLTILTASGVSCQNKIATAGDLSICAVLVWMKRFVRLFYSSAYVRMASINQYIPKLRNIAWSQKFVCLGADMVKKRETVGYSHLKSHSLLAEFHLRQQQLSDLFFPSVPGVSWLGLQSLSER